MPPPSALDLLDATLGPPAPSPLEQLDTVTAARKAASGVRAQPGEARSENLPLSERIKEGAKSYAAAIPLGVAQGAEQIARGTDIGLNKIGIVSDEKLADLDEQAKELRQYSAEHLGAGQGIPVGGGDRVIPASDLETVGKTAAMLPAAIPVVGPELLAAQQAANAHRDATNAGADPQEALARATFAGLGSELGFRVPGLAPEMGAVGDAVGGRAGAAISEGTSGATSGALMDAATPTEDRGDNTSALGILGAALGAAKFRGARQALMDRGGAEVPEAAPAPIDPNAITQEMPVLTEDQITPPTWQPHGPINTEPIKSPASAIRQEDSTQEIGVENAKIDQAIARLEDKKRILSTGRPVVGPDETQIMPPVQGEIPTEVGMDSVRTISPQDEIRTQAAEHQAFPPNPTPDYPTYATADLSPNEAIMRNVRRQQATDPKGFERQGIDALNRGMPPEDHITQVTQDHIQALRDLTAELKAARAQSTPAPTPEVSNGVHVPQEVRPIQASARPQEGGALLDAAQRREADAGHAQPVEEAGRPGEAVKRRVGSPADHQAELSGIAPGERINERPDLALPSKDPAVRDMMKKDDATMGRPEERPRDVANQEAEKRLAGGGEHEERRLEAKMSEPNASLNEAEQAGVRKMIDRAYSAGDADRAVRLHRQLRAVRTEGARAMGAGVDMSEPPAVRAARTIQDLALRPSGRARMIENIAKKHGKKLDATKGDAQVKQDLQRIDAEARKAGIDPNTLQPLPKAPTVGAKVVKKAQALVGARKAKVDADYAKLKDDIKRLWNTKNPSASSTGGALADALTQLAFNRAEAGVLKFSDFVLEAAKIIPGFKSDADAQEQLRKAWESAREKRPDLGMDASERPLDVLVKDAKDRAQALADKWAEKDAEAKAMSPEDRVKYLEQKAAAKQVPEEIASAVKDINDQKKSLQDRIRSRDAAILYNHDRMLRIVQKVKGDAWDTYYEWARSAAHTSLKLPPKKLASDLAQLTYHFGAEAPLARLVNALIPGGKDARSFADLKPMWAGLMPGLRWGWRNALETWKTDTSALRDQVVQAQAEHSIRTGDEFKAGNINEFHGGTRLKGAAKLIRWNIKSVQAFNDLAESTFSRMAVAEHAMTSAAEKGLTGNALRDHLFNEMKDLSSPSWQKALEDAEHLTGTKQVTGKFNPVYWINRARFMDPYDSKSTAEYAAKRVAKEAARWTFLFTTLPYNFAKAGLAISPVGGTARMAGSAAKAGASVLRGGPWDYNRSDFNTHVAQQLIGYAALGLIAETAAGDEPKVTGYEEWNPKREGLRAPPQHSVYLFGKWRDYGGLGPVAHLIGTSADMLKAYHDTLHGKSVGSAAEDVIASMGRQFRDETILRNLGDVHAATTSEEGAARLLSSWATLAYPTMFKQIVKEYGDTKEDHRIKEDPFWKKIAQHVAQDTGASMAYSFPAVDIFGNDILKPSEAGTKAVDYPFRLANPFTGPGDKTGDDDLKRAILNYNETHPEEPVYPTEPSPKFKRPGAAKADEMTRAQFHEYVKLTGQKAADILRAGGPLTDETLPKRVKMAFDTARGIARRQVVGTNVSGEP